MPQVLLKNTSSIYLACYLPLPSSWDISAGTTFSHQSRHLWSNWDLVFQTCPNKEHIYSHVSLFQPCLFCTTRVLICSILFYLFLFFIYQFIMYSVFCLHASLQARRGHQIRWLRATMWLLGIELRTSGRTSEPSLQPICSILSASLLSSHGQPSSQGW